MGLVRLTPDVAEKISKTMGLSPQKIREAINAGTIKGQKMGEESRIYLIDECYLPAEKPPEIPQPKVEVSADTQKTLQEIKDKIEIAKQQIALDEVKGLRDKPEKLAERESKVAERESVVKTLEETLKQKELEINERDKTSQSLQLKTNEDCTKQLREVQTKCRDIEQGHTLLMAKKQKELDAIKAEIAALEAKRVELQTILSQAHDELKPWVELVRSMIRSTESVAAKNARIAENTKGNTSEYYSQQANRAWSISDQLKQVLAWLNR